MTIVTKEDDTGFAPTDSRWTAIDTDTYDGPGSPIGSGATRREALMDLTDKLGAAALDLLQRINPRPDIGSPHPFSSVPDPACLTKARLEASVIIAALQHAAERGVVAFDVSENAVTFMWPLSDAGLRDAMLVFEAIGPRRP